MANKKIKDRLSDASKGYARGGSAARSYKISERARSTVSAVSVAVGVCALIVLSVVLFFKLSMKDFSKDSPKSVTVYYGDLAVRTSSALVYEGSSVRVDMNCVRDMLSLVMTRDGSSVTYSTVSGDRIDLIVGESTVTVNGIRFSLPVKTVEDKGKIFVSAEVINRFISDTTVAVEENNRTVSVISLATDGVSFFPKKSEQMGEMDRPSSIPRDTSYNPEGTAPPSSPDSP